MSHRAAPRRIPLTSVAASMVGGLLLLGVAACSPEPGPRLQSEVSAGRTPDVPRTDPPATPDAAARPTVVDESGGVSFGPTGVAGTAGDDDAVRVDVYVDFMCPPCGLFEETNGAALDTLREDGAVTLVVHAVSILDRASQGTDYSTRAAQAFVYLAERSPEHAYPFFGQLFAQQPDHGSTGLSDAELESIAVGVGVPADVAAGIADGTYSGFVAETTQDATRDPVLVGTRGGFGTPTAVLDGTLFEGAWSTPGVLDAAIQDTRVG